MAKKVSNIMKRITIPKGTSIGRGILKTSTMNKHKRRSFKKYRGQGK